MSDLLNKKYNLELEVLTPLHVGAGAEKDWMKGADYIEDKGKIYILNHKKVASKLSASELSNYLIKKDDEGLKKKLTGSLESVSNQVFKLPAKSDNDIKTFIKNGLSNKPIVPGSSIKGAIRSVLFAYLKEKHQKDEKEVFGSANKGNEFMRFIKIADAKFDKTELVNTKIFNLFGTAPNFNGGWKHEFKGGTNSSFKPSGFNTIYEVIKPNNTGELSIALSDKAFDNFYKNQKPEKKKNILHRKPSEKLFAIINEHTKKYIDKQIAFFEKYSNNETDKIIKSLQNVKNQIPSDNSSCVLKMSAGSGFHSITGDWQFDDFSIDGVAGGKVSRGQKNRKDSAKSRKVAIDGDNFYLMGFVKLSILDEETKAKREAEKQAKIEAEQKAKQERLAKEKAEQERIEAEKRAKEEAERKAEEERLAKEKAERVERERLIKEREEEERQRQEANKAKLAKGLSILEDEQSYNSGKNLIVKYKKGNEINKEDVTMIKSFVEKSFNASDKEWNNFKRGKRWKEISGWVGKQTAQQWYNEITNK